MTDKVIKHSKPSDSDCTLAMLSHLLGIFTGCIGSLVIYLTQKKEGYVKEQSKRALNFQLTLLVGYVISWLLVFIFVGVILIWAIAIVNIVFCVLASVATNQGQNYKYPFSLEFVK